MTDAGSIDLRRYRRRILGWGLLALVVGFAVPAFLAMGSVQDDLERRVEDELAEVGITGVAASFSGQDGTLRCASPLDDEDLALDVASGVYGVRTIDLGPSCRASGDADAGDVGTVATVDSTPPTADSPTSTVGTADGGGPEGDASSDTGTVVTTAPADPTVPTVPEEETIADVVAADPQFSQLASLLAETGLDDTLDVGGPFTLLAPTDEAFDATFEAVGADAFQELVSDPDRLRSVLLHHVTPGAIPSTSMEPGVLTMLDGGTVSVERSANGDLGFASGGVVAGAAEPGQLDIEAANGVIHAIDQVLPGSVIVDGDDSAPGVVVELGTGRIVLGGSVASTAQRGVLLSAAQAIVADEDLLDELVVDASAATADADVDRAAVLMPTFPDRLISGLMTVDVNGVRLTGVVADQAARAAVESLAAEQGAQADLTVLEQPATAEPAVDVGLLQETVDALVEESPIAFEAGSTELVEESDDVIARIAEVLVPVAEADPTVRVTVVGHTDSDGDAARNLLISEGRALRVRDELVLLGVSDLLLVGVGRGETELVLDEDGVEDKAASRRVEFRVARLVQGVT